MVVVRFPRSSSKSINLTDATQHITERTLVFLFLLSKLTEEYPPLAFLQG